MVQYNISTALQWLRQNINQNLNWFAKNTPYLTLRGKIWGVCYEDLEEKWPCYNGTVLCNVLDLWQVSHSQQYKTECDTKNSMYNWQLCEMSALETKQSIEELELVCHWVQLWYLMVLWLQSMFKTYGYPGVLAKWKLGWASWMYPSASGL